MNTATEVVRLNISCPQCAAPVRPPHNADFVCCASCGSTLVLSSGVLIHILREEVRVNRKEAAGFFVAWLQRQNLAPHGEGEEAHVHHSVGEFRLFPFLRIRRMQDERVVPLATLSSPAVARLAHAPAELMDALELLGGVHCSVDQTRLGLERSVLEASLAAAVADPATVSAQVEIRGYYPATYSVRRGTASGGSGRADDAAEGAPGQYTAVIAAGQGVVYPDLLPARTTHSGRRLRLWLLGLALLLVVEAAAVPGLWAALAAVVVTAAVFCGVVWATGAGRA